MNLILESIFFVNLSFLFSILNSMNNSASALNVDFLKGL